MDYKILIVDDNENNLISLKSIIDSMNLMTIEARNGNEALSALMKEKIDLIILDIQLPDYNGFEIAKIIKSRKSTKSIPLIFSTAIYKSEEFLKKGYELGAIDYIFKPINVDAFLSKVRYYYSIELEKRNYLDGIEARNRKLQESNIQLKRLENQLKVSEYNWRLLGENIPSIVQVYDSEANLLFYNKTYERAGYNKELIFKEETILELVSAVLNSQMLKRTVIEIETIEHIEYYEIKGTYFGENGVPKCLVVINDITSSKQYEIGMQYMGYHDQLTGLWNRHYFSNYIQELEVEKCLPISILMADVNGLKLINDGFGHTAGDELIKIAGNTIKDETVPDTIIVRWGGDEFLVFLPNTTQVEAEEISQNICAAIKDQKMADMFPISLAVGESTTEVIDFQMEALIKLAEDRMYVNKLQNQTSYRSFIVESLKNALFEQDYETLEHTERISVMAGHVSEHLELTQNDRDKLFLLASLHDIGKIGISKAILNQPGKLSEIDWNVIRRHPEIGYRICSAVPELSSIAELILCHHERWDGNGYPRQLKGKEIPVLARMISILDTFDVITNDRPYKEKQSAEWALEELKRCAGSQFDPNLVNVFEHVYDIMKNNGEL
jgi:diguanylate cyclase (GGDEF)-like protein